MSAPQSPRRALPYRWELLVWLWLAFFFNQADRQVFSTVLPPLKADLALTDVQAGLVATLFTVVLAIMVPIAGYVGDVCNRTRVVTLSLLGWSIATLASGLASGFWFLLLVRSVATGAGEAFYAPAANALIAEHHDETRGRAMAIHQTSLYLGVIASGLIAGLVAERYGWRSSFWSFGAVGVVLAAVMAFRLRTQAAVAVRTPAPNLTAVFGVLRRRTVLLLALAWACMVFVNIGYMTWMPTFLHEQFSLSLGNAGFSSMFYHHIGAFAGVTLGGALADRWARSNLRARPLLQGFALLAGAPFIWLMGAAPNVAGVYGALALFGVFRGIYDAGIYASLFQVIEPRLRATAIGLVIAVVYIFGSLSPLILGFLKGNVGLSTGLSILAFAYLFGGAALLLAAFRTLGRDLQHMSPPSTAK